MAKVAPDAMLDASLEYVAAGDRVILCSAEPTTYAEATSTYDLATATVTPGDGNGDFTIADGDTSGRKLTVGEQSAVSVDTTGDATHAAVVLTSDTTLRYVTETVTTPLASGGQANFGSWKIELADPS